MAIPVWFDTAHYKAQKLAQLMATDSNGAWTASKLDGVMESAGFSGNEGWFAHFTQYGADEHCSPNATFNAAEYLTAKLAQLKATDPLWTGKSVSDVQAAFKAAGLGEWEHYHKYGMAEGLNPSNTFDELAYLEAKLVQLVSTDPTNWTGKTALDVRSAFQAAELSALEHFMLYGKAENLVAIEVPADKQVTVPSDFHIFGGQGGMPSAGFDLTRGSDNLTGTAGNDSFFAAYANGFQTLNTTDTLNGGAGEDTLYIGADAGVQNFGKASIKSIEHVVSVDDGLLDVSANADVKSVVNKGDVTAKLAQGVTLSEMVDGTSVVKFVDAEGKDDAVTLALNSNDIEKLSVEGIEKLTLNVTGVNANITDDKRSSITFGNKALSELVVTGKGSVMLAEGVNSTIGSTNSISKMDFSENTGGVSVSLAVKNLTKDAAVTGGAGGDSLHLDGNTKDHKLVVDLGAGDDFLSLTNNVHKDATYAGGVGADELFLAGFTTTLDHGKQITGFESFILSGISTFTAGHFAKGITDVAISSTATAYVVNDFSSIDVLGSGAPITSLTMNTASVDLTFDNRSPIAEDGTELGSLIATNMTDLTIHSNGNTLDTVSGANILSNVTGKTTDLFKTITIDGDQDLVLGALSAGTAGTWTDAAALTKIDAAALTGDLYLDVTGGASMGANDKIIGGFGNDTIVVDKDNYLVELTGGAGDDIFNVSDATLTTPPAAATLLGEMTIITDFQKGDKIVVGGSHAIDVAVTNATSSFTTNNATTAFNLTQVTAGATSWFTDGTDSYIVYNPAGNADAITDVIIKIAGVKDLTGLVGDGGEGLVWA